MNEKNKIVIFIDSPDLILENILPPNIFTANEISICTKSKNFGNDVIEFTPILIIFIGNNKTELLAEQFDVPYLVVLNTEITVDAIVEIVRQGAYDCVTKSRLAELEHIIEKAILYRTTQNRRYNLLEKAQIGNICDNIPLPFHILDEKGTILEVNNAWTDFFGLSKKEAIGSNISETLTCEMVPKFYENRSNLINTGNLKNSVFRIITKTKGIRIVSVNSLFKAGVEKDKGLIFSNFQDISTHKNEKLNEIAYQFDELIYSMDDVFYSYDVLREQFTIISPSCKNIFGRSPEEIINFPELWNKAVYFEDNNTALQINQLKTLRNKLSLKYRIIHSDGSVCWVLDKMTPFFDKNKQLIRIDGILSNINKEETLHNEILENSDFKAKILETAQVGYAIFDLEGFCKDFNILYTDTIDIPVSELIDTNLLYSSFWQLHKCDEKFVECINLQKPIQCNISVINFRLKTELFIDSEFSHFLYKGKLHIIQFVRDVTESKNAEKRTLFLAAELQNLIQTINVAIIYFNNEGKITEWNYAAEQLTGYSRTDVLSMKKIFKLITSDLGKMLHYQISEVLKNQMYETVEIEIIHKNGNRKKVLVSGSQRLNINGELIGGAFFAQDISELAEYRSKLEQKIEERTQQLKKALKKEKDVIEMKAKFISMTSHEFRTPLAAINFSNGFLKKYWTRIDETEKLLNFDKIEHHIKHMTMLLDDVLTIGKLESGNMECKLQNINLKEFLGHIAESIYKSGRDTHYIDISNVDESILIEADEKLCVNIFGNLLTNAVKFSPQAKRVVVSAIETEESCEIQVRDYGIGISPKDLERAFEPFHRGENVETIQGTGLGLSIVKHAVDLHGGMLKIESRENEGTIMHVFFPIKKTILENN